MDLKKKTIAGVIWSAIEKLGNQLISFIVFFVLARLLGPESFGLIALADVYLVFLEVFTDQGFTQAIVQRQALEDEHLDTAFWINLVISIGLTLITFIGAGWVAIALKEPNLEPIIKWLSLALIFSSFNGIQQAIFTRRLAFKQLSLRSLIAQLLGGIVGVTMAFMGFGVWSLVGQRLVNQCVGILVLWWVSDWKPKLRISKRHFHDLFGFGVNILGIKLLTFFNKRSDDFLIGYFLGPVPLGYYAIAYRLLKTVTVLITTMTQVGFPAFSQLQNEPEKLKSAFYKGTQFTALISFPLFFGLSSLAPEIIPIMFGEQWHPSIPVMQILMLIGIVHSLGSINTSIILVMGKPDWALKVNIINAVTNVTAFILVVQWGIVAIASAFVIRGYLIPLPTFIIMVKKLIQINLKTYINQLVPALVATGVMVVAILGSKAVLDPYLTLNWTLGLCLVIAPMAYGITIRVLFPTLFNQTLDLFRSLKSS
ncbi:MOP flippase family protein [Roseofilum sp. BLCC_M154]|uniref:MOP flippase family protein n=1 Tax=Roseofilum acuticapitatum BLCC-M154 TaxID=3022444 RepID=A0ABT7ARQ6_9CYAN|nr:MOP flippase family protein [Roseofilum acuticapitatum]MDJ1169587.1 MOP flippase family protein [Roseofilum acuticapitatum BLCC-M154]